MVAVSELPDECHRFAQSLAASQNVSIEEYHIGVGSVDVLVRHAPGDGWTFGDTSCSTRLAFQSNLHVGDQSYNVEGHYTKATLHQKPLFQSGQLLGGLVGVGMFLIGYKGMQNDDSE